MRGVLMAMMMASAPVAAPVGVLAETFQHDYELSVRGLRVGTMALRADVDTFDYSATARFEATGIVGLIAGEGITASVRGARGGDAGFVPQAYAQVREGDSRLDLSYRDGVPVSIVADPPRGADEDPIPTLSRQAGTVDFLTAIVALTLPGTPEEICNRRFDTFTQTERSRIEGQGVVAGADGPACDVVFSDVDPETLKVEDPETFRMDLRQMADGRYEMIALSGRGEVGPARLERVN